LSPNPISSYFITNFEKTLEKLGISNKDDVQYFVYPTAQVEKYTNFDEIYRIWTTPSFNGVRISYNEVIQNLVKTDQNTIPLWIKVTRQNKLVVLEISQRFRKRKQIIERNPDNKISPFEIVEKLEFKFNQEKERKEAIRILFFKRLDENILKTKIGQKIRYDELRDVLSSHFEYYRFYPPLYNHYKSDDERHSKLVIEKDFDSKLFKVFSSNNEENIIEKTDFETVIKYYIHNELNWEYKGIEIETEQMNN